MYSAVPVLVGMLEQDESCPNSPHVTDQCRFAGASVKAVARWKCPTRIVFPTLVVIGTVRDTEPDRDDEPVTVAERLLGVGEIRKYVENAPAAFATTVFVVDRNCSGIPNWSLTVTVSPGTHPEPSTNI